MTARRSTASARKRKQAIDEGYTLIVLSDRAISRGPRADQLRCWPPGRCIITSCGNRKRTRIGIIVETGEAREVHHHCLLVGYGADAINPYLAFEALWQARRDGLLDSGAKVTAATNRAKADSSVQSTLADSDGESPDPVTQDDHDL